MKTLRQSPLKLVASPAAVIAQYHRLPYVQRVTDIVDRVLLLSEEEVASALASVRENFAHRHRDFEAVLQSHFALVHASHKGLPEMTPARALLLGAFLTKEYSFQAAALFNPSIVPHPDQSGLARGEVRFIMSLRATGEGHISSIAFRTGIFDGAGTLRLDEASGLYTPLQRTADNAIDKEFLRRRMNATETFEELEDTNYDLIATGSGLDETVIYPSARCESMGMEDLRLVRFTEGTQVTYYGTYTAYNGSRIKTQLLETTDFTTFRVRTFYGAAIADKGMALFPEKVRGRFAMIARQGSELMSIMFSDDLYRWEHFEVLLRPQFDWEFVQMGNCGAPVKTPRGWLLLIHGVGAMRKYVISAILLDLHHPERVIGRLHRPLLEAGEGERDGYVPNVVYTCGMLLHEGMLLIPYAVSDAATVFATVQLDEILHEMKPYQP